MIRYITYIHAFLYTKVIIYGTLAGDMTKPGGNQAKKFQSILNTGARYDIQIQGSILSID